jgi:hypothetical protein
VFKGLARLALVQEGPALIGVCHRIIRLALEHRVDRRDGFALAAELGEGHRAKVIAGSIFGVVGEALHCGVVRLAPTFLLEQSRSKLGMIVGIERFEGDGLAGGRFRFGEATAMFEDDGSAAVREGPIRRQNDRLLGFGLGFVELFLPHEAEREHGVGLGVVRQDGYETNWLPSFRMIVDLGDLNNSITVHTTGQSGHAYNEHYDDMAPMWANVEYYSMLWSEQSIMENAEGHLVLSPK